jgi:hypothetical protein
MVEFCATRVYADPASHGVMAVHTPCKSYEEAEWTCKTWQERDQQARELNMANYPAPVYLVTLRRATEEPPP